MEPSSTVRTVTSASPATPVRLFVSILAVAALLAVLLADRTADAAGAGNADLAAGATCAGADDASATPAAQARAVACLVNWARSQGHRLRLSRRPALQRAAALKGRRVASCGQLSHTPCGAAVTSGVTAAGYRFATYGENLFVGTWGRVSARDVVAAWLQSPPHRANLLSPAFRHVGAAPVRASGLLGRADAVVWTATFAAPR